MSTSLIVVSQIISNIKSKGAYSALVAQPALGPHNACATLLNSQTRRKTLRKAHRTSVE